MRTLWKGYLKISLVTIPVKMYNAVVGSQGIHFNLLHEKCGTRIRQQNYCPNCNQVLSNEEIIKGYRYGKDKYVPVTDEEIEKAKRESTDAIEVIRFVDQEQIPPIYYSDSHYLVPDGKVATEAFALFRQAIGDAGKTALAKVVIRNREYLFSIKPHDGIFIAYTLHYPREIQSVSEIEESEKVSGVKLDKQGLSMATELIGNLSGDFRPEDLVDEYSEALMNIIKAKAEGKEYVVEREERKKVVSLMEALKRSVKESRTLPRKEMAVAGKRKATEKRKRKTA